MSAEDVDFSPGNVGDTDKNSQVLSIVNINIEQLSLFLTPDVQ